MADYFEKEVLDTYKQHKYHQTNHRDCSSCFTENLVIMQQREESWKKLKNSYGSNYPLGYRPE